MLIIIGHGCKDVGINEMIKEYFDYQNKPIYIIDKYAGEEVEKFSDSVHAKLHKVDIENINTSIFM